MLKPSLILLCFVLGCTLPVLRADETDQVAVSLFKAQLSLAEKGDVDGQFHVGEMYEKGLGTKQDFSKAFEWYSKSAKLGNTRAKDKLKDWDRTVDEAVKIKERAEAEATRAQQAIESQRAAERAKAAQEAARARAAAEEAARARAAAEAAAAKAKTAAERTKATEKAKPPEKPPEKETAKSDTAGTEDGKSEFTTNPCKGPQAKFLSTCK